MENCHSEIGPPPCGGPAIGFSTVFAAAVLKTGKEVAQGFHRFDNSAYFKITKPSTAMYINRLRSAAGYKTHASKKTTGGRSAIKLSPAFGQARIVLTMFSSGGGSSVFYTPGHLQEVCADGFQLYGMESGPFPIVI